MGALSEDERHRVLAAERRRVLLDVLAEREPPVHVEELAAAVADREEAVVDQEAVQEVAVGLHHVHLPTLGACGVVDYDPDTNVVVSFDG